MDDEKNAVSQEPVIHDFSSDASFFPRSGISLRETFTPKILAIFAVFIVLGLFTGFILSSGKGIISIGKGGTTASNISKGEVFGSDDTKTFKDTVSGILKKGGIDGEGVYHLVRPGGDSQNVYLTSSIVDLSQFLDRKIKVWGETQKGKRAGWLMDVGRVEILE